MPASEYTKKEKDFYIKKISEKYEEFYPRLIKIDTAINFAYEGIVSALQQIRDGKEGDMSHDKVCKNNVRKGVEKRHENEKEMKKLDTELAEMKSRVKKYSSYIVQFIRADEVELKTNQGALAGYKKQSEDQLNTYSKEFDPLRKKNIEKTFERIDNMELNINDISKRNRRFTLLQSVLKDLLERILKLVEKLRKCNFKIFKIKDQPPAYEQAMEQEENEEFSDTKNSE